MAEMGDWRQELQDKLFPKEQAGGGGGGSGGRKWTASAKQAYCKHKWENGEYCGLPILKDRIGGTRCIAHRADENAGCPEHDRLNCGTCG